LTKSHFCWDFDTGLFWWTHFWFFGVVNTSFEIYLVVTYIEIRFWVFFEIICTKYRNRHRKLLWTRITRSSINFLNLFPYVENNTLNILQPFWKTEFEKKLVMLIIKACESNIWISFVCSWAALFVNYSLTICFCNTFFFLA